MSKKVSKTAAGLLRIVTVYAKLEILLGLALIVGLMGYWAMERQPEQPKTSLSASTVKF